MSKRFKAATFAALAVSAMVGTFMAGPGAGAAPAPVTVTAEVTSVKGYPLTVGEFDTARLNVNLHHRFRSISKLCVTVYADPADPFTYNDTMLVSEATATSGSKPKFYLPIYNYDVPHPSDTFCDPYWGTNRLLDGKATLKLWGGQAWTYDHGSATFLRITMSVTGEPK